MDGLSGSLGAPQAALAVLDLADRIHKRRRATELIDHAQQLATQHVNVHLITQNRTVELRTLTPDQLLDLAHDDSAS
jgi:molybdenum cofactor biosynthesis enzyme